MVPEPSCGAGNKGGEGDYGYRADRHQDGSYNGGEVSAYGEGNSNNVIEKGDQEGDFHNV